MRRVIVSIVASALLATALTSYTEMYVVRFLMPVRNLALELIGERQPPPQNVAWYETVYNHGTFVNPVSVSQTTLTEAQAVLNGVAITPAEAEALMRVAVFLQQYARPPSQLPVDGRAVLVLPYEFHWAHYDLPPGWLSAMAQGQAIQVLLAAEQLSNDPKFHETAVALGHGMVTPIAEGGTSLYLPDGLWLEEYAHVDRAPSYALNGHIYALEGLYYLALRENAFSPYVDQALSGLVHMLPEFNLWFWSAYDLRGTVANQRYHNVHIRQLEWLHELLACEPCLGARNTFVAQQATPFSALFRLIVYPTRFLVVVFMFYLVALMVVFWLWPHATRAAVVIRQRGLCATR